jgi:glycosyltransferase involved in cell wall biosynthesis
MEKFRILIALPAFNEEKVIGEVISEIKKKGYENILVVNDGSSDKTAKCAENFGAFVVSHFKNSGLGVSLRTAIRFAKQNDYDSLVTMDSDGQHKSLDIQKFIEKINKGFDIVVGARDFKKASVARSRKIILFFSDLYTRILFGVKTKDSQSGFRAFSRRAINSINLKSERMEVSSEIFAEIGKNKLKYAEVPIEAIYTKYSLAKGQKNSNMFRVGWKLLINMFK